MSATSNPLPPNATLIFQNPTGAIAQDRLGSFKATTEELTVRAYLRRDKRQPTQEVDLGTELSRVWVKGYIIEVVGSDPSAPQVLPAGIVPGVKAQCTLTGAWSVKGDFFLQADTPSPFEVVEDILGQKLIGYISTTVAWGS